tara:strand:- start:8302 stop:8691 length:390 start_codon:yes stop_codon:yes gene_type:complete
MKIGINTGLNFIKINREDITEKFNNESTLLYHVKEELIKMGFDVIKKRMWKDGHLMGDDETQYIRERNHLFYIYDSEYERRLIHKDFNREGFIFLSLAINSFVGSTRKRNKFVQETKNKLIMYSKRGLD